MDVPYHNMPKHNSKYKCNKTDANTDVPSTLLVDNVDIINRLHNFNISDERRLHIPVSISAKFDSIDKLTEKYSSTKEKLVKVVHEENDKIYKFGDSNESEATKTHFEHMDIRNELEKEAAEYYDHLMDVQVFHLNHNK